jgi:hypothetical protein
MALRKSIDSNYGVPATYWHILRTDVNWKTLRASIEVVGYVSQEARRTNKEQVLSKIVNIDISGMVFIPMQNLFELASIVYGFVKLQIPEFADAEDILEEGQTIVDILPYLPQPEEYIPDPEPPPTPYPPPYPGYPGEYIEPEIPEAIDDVPQEEPVEPDENI